MHSRKLPVYNWNIFWRYFGIYNP